MEEGENSDSDGGKEVYRCRLGGCVFVGTPPGMILIVKKSGESDPGGRY